MEMPFDKDRALQIKEIVECFFKKKKHLFQNLLIDDTEKVFKIIYGDEDTRISFGLPDLDLRTVDGLDNKGFDFALRDKFGIWGGVIDENGSVIHIDFMSGVGTAGQGSEEDEIVVLKSRK